VTYSIQHDEFIPVHSVSDAVYLKEQKLYDALFANYSKLFRPSQKTVVQFALSLATILEIVSHSRLLLSCGGKGGGPAIMNKCELNLPITLVN